MVVEFLVGREDGDLDEMAPEGLVTLEKARVVKYSPGNRPVDTGR